jgi:hypothetical protein
MLIGKDMPMFLWAEAIQYSTWLKNQFPSRAMPGYMPHTLIYKMKPNLANVHEFRSKVYVHTMDGRKLEARASEAIFVGIDKQSKAYWVYWANQCSVSVKRNVTFAPLQPMIPEEVMDEGEFDVEEHISKGPKVGHHIPPTPAQVPAPLQTPPTISAPLPEPTALRITCTRQPAGYYRTLNEGQHTSSATTATPDDKEHSSIHWALTAAEAEPTLREALSGPNGPEWQAAVDYKINQLEKLKA